MPSINDIKSSSKQKKFKKREYRPWNINGENHEKLDPINSSSSESINTESIENECIYVSPSDIEKWEFKDRPDNELGDIESLASELKTIGQQQPCIVRISSNPEYKYTLIIGERRWRASLIANIDLLVIVKNMTDSESALAQAAENESRKNLSDYAKGMSYAKLLASSVITQKDLMTKLGISKQNLSRLLSFNKIPTSIIDAIGDMSLISAGTAEKIKQLSAKGNDYINAIIDLAPKIKLGKLGHEKLNSMVINTVNKIENSKKETKKVYTKDGRHLFTWRLDNNSRPSIHFPNNILNLINSKNIGINKISSKITEIIEYELKNMK